MSPLGLPGDVLKALRLLPGVADRLDAIAGSTGEMPAMRRAIEEVGDDTQSLDTIAAQLARIDARMETIEAAMPTLVEVQQHLARLPEAIEGLTALLSRLLDSMDALDGTVTGLQNSIEPIGDLADRLPGGGRRRA